MPSERIFLLAGEYHFTRRPSIIATLLGSCVSVCLYDTEDTCAGMNHFLLPRSPEKPEHGRGFYGNTSTEMLVNVFGSSPRNMEAKVFGGAHLSGSDEVDDRKLAQDNITAAIEVLEHCKIPVIENDTGGEIARRVYFDTLTHKVVVRKIKRNSVVDELVTRREHLALRDVKVLIVDDSALVRKVLRTAISQVDGMTVCGEAADAYEARDMVLTASPDVICLDIIMPRLDGLKFLEKLNRHHPCPVVICSTIAHKNSPVAEKAKKLGAHGIVNKEDLRIYEGLDGINNHLVPLLRAAAFAPAGKQAGFDSLFGKEVPNDN